jgi:hypothetical protein
MVLLGGTFTSIGGSPRNRIARLHANGALDVAFDPDANDAVQSLAIQADGKVLVGGSFASVGGVARSRFARLSNDEAVQNLTIPDSTRVQWLRAGAAPEVEQVTFDLSTDGGNSYSPLGAGSRIAGGWELTGLGLLTTGQIRACGRSVNGGSGSGLTEQVALFTSLAPLRQWKLTHLGDADAPDLDDPDHDGIRTLAEYGLNLLPQTPNAAPFVPRTFAYAEGERLRIFLQRNPAHNDVTVEVQAANNLAGPWAALATSTLGAPFSGPGYVGGDAATPGVKTVEIRDTVNIPDAPERFLRVQVRH